MKQQMAQDVAIAGAKAAPGVAVAVTGVTGAVNWSDIAYMLTALYMLAQVLLLIPKYRQMIREWRQGKPDCEK